MILLIGFIHAKWTFWEHTIYGTGELDWIRTIETLTYNSTLYTWHHESQNLYQVRHLTIYDAIQVITRNDSVVRSQCVGGEERYKHIGLSPAGIIAVITDETETRIITAWHASTTEVKEWLTAN